jgi:hypothetical protein
LRNIETILSTKRSGSACQTKSTPEPVKKDAATRI